MIKYVYSSRIITYFWILSFLNFINNINKHRFKSEWNNLVSEYRKRFVKEKKWAVCEIKANKYVLYYWFNLLNLNK